MTNTKHPARRKKGGSSSRHRSDPGIIAPRWWRRRLVFATVVVAVGSIVYAGVTLDSAQQRIDRTAVDAASRPSATSPAEPGDTQRAWYLTQDPPPSMVTVPDTPLFPQEPDAIAAGDPVRPYEEALPDDVIDERPVQHAAAAPAEPDAVIPDSMEPAGQAAANPAPAPAPDTAALPETARAAGPSTPAAQPDRHQGAGTPAEATVPGAAEMPAVAANRSANDTMQLAWQRFAVPAPAVGNRPMVAIVIDDMGIDKKRSHRAIELPAPLTLAFLTYATGLDEITRDARARGHELMVHVAMEPTSAAVDPGPNVLRVTDDPVQTLDRLRWGLSRFTGYVGINNHMGSRFTQDRAGMRLVLAELKARGLLFLDSRTAGASVARKVAGEVGVPFVQRNVFLDDASDEWTVAERLDQVERLARRNGAAVAIGHPHDATLNALETWLAAAKARGIELVPISAIVRHHVRQVQNAALAADQG